MCPVQHSISFVYRSYHLPMPDPSPSTLTVNVHYLQLPTARKKEWRPATADSSPQAVICQHCDTRYFSRPRTHNLPIGGSGVTMGWLLCLVTGAHW